MARVRGIDRDHRFDGDGHDLNSHSQWRYSNLLGQGNIDHESGNVFATAVAVLLAACPALRHAAGCLAGSPCRFVAKFQALETVADSQMPLKAKWENFAWNRAPARLS